jgi:hypothetical protein
MTRVVDQRYENDCGIAAVATVTGLTWEDVYSAWPGGFHGDSSDSYIHHQKALHALGFSFKRVLLEELLTGAGHQPGSVAMLLNAQDDPATWAREDYTNLHWCVYAGRSGSDVLVYWLNGRVKTFSAEMIRKHFSNPFCVCYSVEQTAQTSRLPWYKRAYVRLTAWIGSKFGGGLR